LINPGPDGDRTCIRGDISPEQAQQMACEERKKLMTPSEHFSVTCDDLTRPTLARTYDICHDPRARPTDDTTCAGSHGLPPGTSFGQGPQPKPYAMTVQETVLSDLNLLRP
jgi:hypothetical protein